MGGLNSTSYPRPYQHQDIYGLVESSSCREACDACEASVDPALAPSDIVAACCVCMSAQLCGGAIFPTLIACVQVLPSSLLVVL